MPFKFPPVFLKFCNLIRKALRQKDQNWTWFKRIQLISTNMTGVGRVLIVKISFSKRKFVACDDDNPKEDPSPSPSYSFLPEYPIVV